MKLLKTLKYVIMPFYKSISVHKTDRTSTAQHQLVRILHEREHVRYSSRYCHLPLGHWYVLATRPRCYCRVMEVNILIADALTSQGGLWLNSLVLSTEYQALGDTTISHELGHNMGNTINTSLMVVYDG